MTAITKTTKTTGAIARTTGAIALTLVREFAPKRRAERNASPRGNGRLFAAAFSQPFDIVKDGKMVSLNYINPNKDGRGGVLPYVADLTGCVVAIFKDAKGQEFARFKSEDDCSFYGQLYGQVADASPANVRARAMADYREAVAKAKQQPNGSLAKA